MMSRCWQSVPNPEGPAYMICRENPSGSFLFNGRIAGITMACCVTINWRPSFGMSSGRLWNGLSFERSPFMNAQRNGN